MDGAGQVLLGVPGAGEYLGQLGAAIEQLPDLRQVDLLGLGFPWWWPWAPWQVGSSQAAGGECSLPGRAPPQGRDVRPGELAARLPCGARAGLTSRVVRTATPGMQVQAGGDRHATADGAGDRAAVGVEAEHPLNRRPLLVVGDHGLVDL